ANVTRAEQTERSRLRWSETGVEVGSRRDTREIRRRVLEDARDVVEAIFHHLESTSRFLFFFFSSRRRHTRWPRDWSSDVCSSDLPCPCGKTYCNPSQGRTRVAPVCATTRCTTSSRRPGARTTTSPRVSGRARAR